jgi:hypothetical protein
MPVRVVRISLAHEDTNPAARIGRVGRIPFTAIDNVVIAVAHDRALDLARDKARNRCLDCGIQTTFTRNGWEYYMLHDALWLTANPQINGMFCIGCLENRIGRTLTSDDFTGAPSNQPRRNNSKRLALRLAA